MDVPVPCLRWTHDNINRNMMFGHGGAEDASIYKLVDEPRDIHKPLEMAASSRPDCACPDCAVRGRTAHVV